MKALFIPFAPSLAHVSRCLAVAEAWRARGHTAIFALGDDRKAFVEAAGFETRTVPEVSGKDFLYDHGFFTWLTADYLSENIAAEKRIIAETGADVIVTDFRFTACLSARMAGVPSASILHGAAFYFVLPSMAKATARLMMGDPGQGLSLSNLRARILQGLSPLVYGHLMKTAIRRISPLPAPHPSLNSIFELLLGDEILAADLAELIPAEPPRPTHVVGPLAWSGWERPAPWLDELDGRPIVYVTMGTTGDGEGTLARVLGALDDGAYNVVVSTGGRPLPKGLDLPPCIHVHPAVPGATVARRSVAVIHHGGHETLMQALEAGVPSLILPGNPDQVLVAQQAQALGIGLSLRQPGSWPGASAKQKSVPPEAIRAALDGLVADADRSRACQAYKHKLAEYGRTAAAVEKLEALATKGLKNKPSMPA